MTVSDVVRDPQALTLTVTSRLAAPRERVWQVWADPRQLEQWWGPPGWPATFTDHDFVGGGVARYAMTGPDGERAAGWWRFLRVDPPVGLELEDGFGDGPDAPAPGMPVVRMVARLDEADGGTRMTLTSHFASLEHLEQLVAMGMEEGIRAASEQLDVLLAGGVVPR